MSESKIYASDIERIYNEWNDALATKNIDALLALYNSDILTHNVNKNKSLTILTST